MLNIPTENIVLDEDAQQGQREAAAAEVSFWELATQDSTNALTAIRKIIWELACRLETAERELDRLRERLRSLEQRPR